MEKEHSAPDHFVRQGREATYGKANQQRPIHACGIDWRRVFCFAGVPASSRCRGTGGCFLCFLAQPVRGYSHEQIEDADDHGKRFAHFATIRTKPLARTPTNAARLFGHTARRRGGLKSACRRAPWQQRRQRGSHQGCRHKQNDHGDHHLAGGKNGAHAACPFEDLSIDWHQLIGQHKRVEGGQADSHLQERVPARRGQSTIRPLRKLPSAKPAMKAASTVEVA